MMKSETANLDDDLRPEYDLNQLLKGAVRGKYSKGVTMNNAPVSPEGVLLQWADVEQSDKPIVLKKNGQPVAVVLKYAEYTRWHTAQQAQRETTWQELETLLAQVHQRTQPFTPDEIEADILAAHQEVRDLRHGPRHNG
jgi:PHD/YefM family antitoxin component YafN of YafNO toxin-antitoxin module